jgi:hypothetical protein
VTTPCKDDRDTKSPRRGLRALQNGNWTPGLVLSNRLSVRSDGEWLLRECGTAEAVDGCRAPNVSVTATDECGHALVMRTKQFVAAEGGTLYVVTSGTAASSVASAKSRKTRESICRVAWSLDPTRARGSRTLRRSWIEGSQTRAPARPAYGAIARSFSGATDH